MKLILPLLLSLLAVTADAQTTMVTGRVFYDNNNNFIFDGDDQTITGQTVNAMQLGTVVQSTTTTANGFYTMALGNGTFTLSASGNYDTEHYANSDQVFRTYARGGTDTVNLTYQRFADILNIYYNITNSIFSGVGSGGGTMDYTLTYGYDGIPETIPGTVTLHFSSKLTFLSADPAPTEVGDNFARWHFSDVPRNEFTNNPTNLINLSLNFPAVGDTIYGFQLVPKFTPDPPLVSPPYYGVGPYIEYTFPGDPLPAAMPTNGVKWLRQYPTTDGRYGDGRSIDTIANSAGYFTVSTRSDGFGPNNILLSRLNADGLSIWEQQLSSLPQNMVADRVSALKSTPDGGFILVGVANKDSGFVTYSQDMFAAKFDGAGNSQWWKFLHGASYEEPGFDFAVLPDGSSMITGSTESNDGDFIGNNQPDSFSNVFVTKLSASGDIVFLKFYGGTRNETAYTITALQNNQFIVSASTSSNDGDVTGAHPRSPIVSVNGDVEFSEEAWILKLDANGNILWQKCLGGSKESYLPGVAENNGGILLTGFTNSKDGDLAYYPEMCIPLWVVQLSSTGTKLWDKQYKLFRGYQDSNYLVSAAAFYDNIFFSPLQKMPDGNFVVGGQTSDNYDPLIELHGGAGTDVAIAKISPAGNIIWKKAIGGSFLESISSIKADQHGDILFIGEGSSNDGDLYLPIPGDEVSIIVGKLGITNRIKGQVFIDNNNNHFKDASERYYSEGRINSIKRTDTVSARIFGGHFLNNVDTGNYVTTYNPGNSYYTIFPASRQTNFTNIDLTDSFDFALTPKPNINDLEIKVTPLSFARPGFDATYRIITKNVGTTTISNVVIGLKKDSRQTYLNASRPRTGILADSIWWGPFTLNAFGIDTLTVNLKLATPPALNNGDTLTITATANPVANDSSTNNNVYTLKEIVRGSFDPNDKTEIHAGILSTTQYAGGDYLNYMIRFQNTGTDTAFFITVKDTLQSNLDPKSLDMIATSHPYTFRMEGNVATWDFKMIKLVDSTTDEASSHGFIQFKIKPKTGLNVGDEFTNKAAIYFDYNLPVITNEDKTLLGVKAGVCPGSNALFAAGITGTTFQWQVNNGSGYTNISNTGIYSGAATSVLKLAAPATSLYGYRYRCLVNGSTYGPEYILKFSVSWKGTTTAWETASNWDCNVLPDANTDVIIPAGTIYPQISSNPSCYSLKLSPGSTVTVKTGFKLTITGKAD